jgi:hypothetical protein
MNSPSVSPCWTTTALDWIRFARSDHELKNFVSSLDRSCPVSSDSVDSIWDISPSFWSAAASEEIPAQSRACSASSICRRTSLTRTPVPTETRPDVFDRVGCRNAICRAYPGVAALARLLPVTCSASCAAFRAEAPIWSELVRPIGVPCGRGGEKRQCVMSMPQGAGAPPAMRPARP